MPLLPTDSRSSDAVSEKQALRTELRRLRREIPAEQKRMMDDALCESVLMLPAFSASDTLLGFYPLAQEPNILPVLERALALGKRCALPRCHPEDCTMTFHLVTDLDALTEGYYGLREPSSKAPVLQDFSHALCLVPALSFDKHGYRIGYGKGYYDRFLCDFTGVCAGLCYTALLRDNLPRESTDLAVSMIITERGILLP